MKWLENRIARSNQKLIVTFHMKSGKSISARCESITIKKNGNELVGYEMTNVDKRDGDNTFYICLDILQTLFPSLTINFSLLHLSIPYTLLLVLLLLLYHLLLPNSSLLFLLSYSLSGSNNTRKTSDAISHSLLLASPIQDSLISQFSLFLLF